MTGIPNFLQYRSNTPFIVELNTRPFTNIGLSSGNPKNSNTYGSLTISSGFSISFPFRAN